jgi:hypothetical protein
MLLKIIQVNNLFDLKYIYIFLIKIILILLKKKSIFSISNIKTGQTFDNYVIW